MLMIQETVYIVIKIKSPLKELLSLPVYNSED
jgi:hypothetical protein